MNQHVGIGASQSPGDAFLEFLASPLQRGIGPELYRLNGFRLSGLRVDADNQQMRRQYEEMRLAARRGEALPIGGVLPLIPPPSAEVVAERMQQLRGDPQQRLMDELFWLWPRDSAGEKPDTVLCLLERGQIEAATAVWREQAASEPEDPVSMHNLAVLAHARALDFEFDTRLNASAQRTRDELWEESFRCWRAVLEREFFWIRMTMRVGEIDDPQIPLELVQRLRIGLPVALMSINAHLAVRAIEAGAIDDGHRHVGLVRRSGFDASVVDKMLQFVVKPIVEHIWLLGENAEERVDAIPKDGAKRAKALLKQVKPSLTVVDVLLPKGDRIRDGVHDQLAQRILHCVVPYANETQDWATSLKLLEKALGIVATNGARRLLQENREIVAEYVESEKELGSVIDVLLRMASEG